VLRQLVWRLNTLGWTGRTQFEETWMCLLSVLNFSWEDLTNEEVAALSQSIAQVVAAISSLLVATLATPIAGVPGARPLHHPRDSPHHCHRPRSAADSHTEHHTPAAAGHRGSGWPAGRQLGQPGESCVTAWSQLGWIQSSTCHWIRGCSGKSELPAHMPGLSRRGRS
jgi:hypothetical protein